jgi:hypothetical protein
LNLATHPDWRLDYGHNRIPRVLLQTELRKDATTTCLKLIAGESNSSVRPARIVL